MKRMKVVIFGLGSIGKRHAEILQDHFPCELFAFRSGGKKLQANELGIPEIHSWEQVKALKPDIAFVTNPTFLHIETALKAASLGLHLFIEKPISNNLDGITSLEALCRRKKINCYVAYGLRFHPVIKELKRFVSGKEIYHVRIVCSSYLPSWRKGTSSKDSYSGVASQGGGVLLDLSHEFDYIKYLFGDIKKISGVYGKMSTVSFDSEDFSDVLLSTNCAPHINLHLNFLSLLNERRIIIDHQHGCIIGDLVENKIELLSGFKKKIKQFKVTRDDYLKEQTKYFFNNLKNPLVMNNLNESKSTLKKILEFKKHG